PPAVTPGPVWSPDGSGLSFVAADRGSAHLVRSVFASGETSAVVGGERQLTFASAVPGKRIAFVAGDLANPADVYVCDWDGGSERRLTELNRELLARLDLPRAERRSFANPNGGTVEGWLLLPAERRGPAPLLVDIHGGPAGFAGNLLSLTYFYRYVLAARGWAVLALNPTGSGSFRREFAHGIRGRGEGPDRVRPLSRRLASLPAERQAEPPRRLQSPHSGVGHEIRVRRLNGGRDEQDRASRSRAAAGRRRMRRAGTHGPRRNARERSEEHTS